MSILAQRKETSRFATSLASTAAYVRSEGPPTSRLAKEERALPLLVARS